MTIARLYAWLFAAIYGAYLLFFGLVLRSRSAGFVFDISTVVMPAIEVTFFYMIGRMAWQFRQGAAAIPAMVVFLACPLVVMSVYVAQMFSGYLSGEYISVVALENISEVQFIKRSFLNVCVVFCAMLWLGLLFVSVRRRNSDPVQSVRRRDWAATVIVALLFVAMFDSGSARDAGIQLRADMVPVTSLVRKLRTLHQQTLETVELGNKQEGLVALLMEKGADLKSPYPLMRDTAYTAPLPFEKSAPTVDHANVIVIFAEGLSARWMATYRSKYSDVTPNLDRFAADTMVVDNYYNHTAPTYRGVKGLLSSGFPRLDGREPGGWSEEGVDNSLKLMRLNYPTLTGIFNRRSYATAFMSPQAEDVNLNNMLRSLGFGTVYSFATLPELLNGTPLRPTTGVDSATDHDIFAAAISYLKRQEAAKDRAPFFLGLYNVGTHAFLDVDEQGVKYGDGSNIALNRIHNYDVQIGPFLEYFEQSSLADNTILIFTTDHATYNEPPVVQALDGPGYKPYFVDQVPLLIFDRGHSLPAHFDAKHRTSIDLAPTILHLLGLKDVKNAFIGFSLFETPPDYHASVSAVGEDFYLITPNGVEKVADVTASDPRYKAYVEYIKLYWMLEVQNRIFPPSMSRGAFGPGA